MKTRSKIVAGALAGLIAVSAFGAAANAATPPGTITGTSGPAAGGTDTTITSAALANITVTQASGPYALGTDGAVYTNAGVKISPDGVTFTQISGMTAPGVQQWVANALASDGSWWTNGGSFDAAPLHKVNLPVAASQVSGAFALGTDGAIYIGDGTKIANPGVTFTQLEAESYSTTTPGVWVASAIASDGSWWTNDYAGGYAGQPLRKETQVPTVSQVSGPYALGTDGAVHIDTLNTGVKVSPAGVSFTQSSGVKHPSTAAGWVASAVASDGTFWSNDNNGGRATTLTKVNLPVTVSQASGAYALGTDGAVYTNGGVKISPAGTTFSQIGGTRVATSGWLASAVASDGTFWVNSNLGTSPLVKTLARTLTVTGVTFDGIAATNVSQPTSTTIAATTPAHAAGPVDVVVTTKLADNTAGPTLTLPQSFTYIATQSVAPSITSPTGGSAYLNDGKSPFTGTGQPGSTITIKDGAGNAVCTTTVDGNGDWTCTPQGALKPGDGSTITVEQNDGTNTLTTTIVLDVAQGLAGPIVEPAGLLLASVLLAAAAGAGVVIVRRRRLAGQA